MFDGVIARFPAPLTLMANGQAERVYGELVTGNYFDVLGVRAHDRPHLHAGRRHARRADIRSRS